MRPSTAARPVATAGALAGCTSASDSSSSGIIDTHTHFYDPRRPQGVPWPPQDDPVLYRPVLPGTTLYVLVSPAREQTLGGVLLHHDQRPDALGKPERVQDWKRLEIWRAAVR